MGRRAETRWPDAHVKLGQLYRQRVEAAGITRAEFGKMYGIGTPAMVWQYITGYTPLNYDVAARFAKGLGCRIEDFSPEMANELASQIIPLLNLKTLKRAVKAATTALVLLTAAPFLDREAHAAFDITFLSESVLNTHMRKFFRRLLGLASILA